MKIDKILAFFVLSVGIVFGGFLVSSSMRYIKDFERSVKVKGLDEMNVKSDLGIFSLSFGPSSNDLNDLYRKYTESQKKITDFFISQGIKKEEIEMTSLEVSENRTSHSPGRLAYTGLAKATISSSDVDKIKHISKNTANLVEKGVIITYNDTKFFFTNLNKVKNEMLERAIKTAYLSANSFANQTGSKLGKIRNATQGVFSITDANTNEEWATTKSIQKKVRVVVAVDYFLE